MTKRFDREELDQTIDLVGRVDKPNAIERDFAQALSLALAVVDESRDDGGPDRGYRWCKVCDRQENRHLPDCPVAACVAAGLTKGGRDD